MIRDKTIISADIQWLLRWLIFADIIKYVNIWMIRDLNLISFFIVFFCFVFCVACVCVHVCVCAHVHTNVVGQGVGDSDTFMALASVKF